jgi:ribosome-interacting GTPase 1
VSPTSKTDLIQTDMMKAIVHKKQTEDQHIQLRARIMKLQKEAEKANKRLNDLERRQ